jgi:transcriptional regulator with XRE-family HTH domain
MIAINFQTPHEAMLLLAQRLRQQRIQAGYSQSQLATRAGVAVNTVRRFEAGRAISLEHFLCLAWGLGLDGEFAALLEWQPLSIADVLRAEAQPKKPRQRVSRVRS